MATATAVFDEDFDFALALQLQEETDQQKLHDSISRVESKAPVTDAKTIVDPVWETIDPTPDIHGLFIEFNQKYFWNRLSGIEVKWSTRMTLCAGMCVYQGYGGLCSVRLSQPLLSYRPRKDLIETLLHEMIHAYLFVTANNRDHDAHGPEFHKHMYRINKESGAKITVYHNFHDEVEHYKTHWWLCNGPCRSRRPFYGMVKRAMNRPPGPSDWWWEQHQRECGGTYTKIKEPENFQSKKNKRKIEVEDSESKRVKSRIPESTFVPASGSDQSVSRKRETKVQPSIKNFLNSPQTPKPKIPKIESQDFQTSLPGSSSSLSPNQSRPLQTIKLNDLLKKENNQWSSSGLKDSTPLRKRRSVSWKGRKKSSVSFSFSDDSDSCEIISPIKTLSTESEVDQSRKKPVSPWTLSLKSSQTSKIIPDPSKYECPICHASIEVDTINDHLDLCLARDEENFL